jgi:hypothetical protein
MFPHSIIVRFGLVSQHQLSPDGYPIYISENLSNNNPTVFFEPYKTISSDTNSPVPDTEAAQRRVVRITKAGAVDRIVISMDELAELSFETMQQKIESELHIPG